MGFLALIGVVVALVGERESERLASFGISRQRFSQIQDKAEIRVVLPPPLKSVLVKHLSEDEEPPFSSDHLIEFNRLNRFFETDNDWQCMAGDHPEINRLEMVPLKRHFSRKPSPFAFYPIDDIRCQDPRWCPPGILDINLNRGLQITPEVFHATDSVYVDVGPFGSVSRAKLQAINESLQEGYSDQSKGEERHPSVRSKAPKQLLRGHSNFAVLMSALLCFFGLLAIGLVLYGA